MKRVETLKEFQVLFCPIGERTRCVYSATRYHAASAGVAGRYCGWRTDGRSLSVQLCALRWLVTGRSIYPACRSISMPIFRSLCAVPGLRLARRNGLPGQERRADVLFPDGFLMTMTDQASKSCPAATSVVAGIFHLP